MKMISFCLKFQLKGSIDNKSTLVQMMTLHRIGDKPLPEPMMTQFIVLYRLQQASICELIGPWEIWMEF